MHRCNLCLHLHMVFSPLHVYASVSKFPSHKDSSCWMRAQSNPVWSQLDYICKNLFFQIKYHSEASGEQGFARGHNSTQYSLQRQITHYIALSFGHIDIWLREPIEQLLLHTYHGLHHWINRQSESSPSMYQSQSIVLHYAKSIF